MFIEEYKVKFGNLGLISCRKNPMARIYLRKEKYLQKYASLTSAISWRKYPVYRKYADKIIRRSAFRELCLLFWLDETLTQ